MFKPKDICQVFPSICRSNGANGAHPRAKRVEESDMQESANVFVGLTLNPCEKDCIITRPA